MTSRSDCPRTGRRPSAGWGSFFAPVLSWVALLVFSLILGGAETAQAVSGTGMKGPPALPQAQPAAASEPAASHPPRQILLSGIRFFQKWISPIDGPRCNFSPTCSTFGYQALHDHDVLLGVMATADRLMRCHYLMEPDAGYERLPDGKLYDPVSHNLPNGSR